MSQVFKQDLTDNSVRPGGLFFVDSILLIIHESLLFVNGKIIYFYSVCKGHLVSRRSALTNKHPNEWML